jgi:UDPglucose--hexose-1-phosphate uridylyltransferase
MTDLRRDPLFDRTVIIAEERGERPNDFAHRAHVLPQPTAESCPFCPGHEHQTPPAVYEQLDPQEGWRVRVVPNKYPAVRPDECGDEAGAHEVIIETPQHTGRPVDLSPDELVDVLDAYRHRLRYWGQSGRFRYGLVFKNVGVAAGASLVHMHAQLLALAILPPAVERELERLKHFAERMGVCGICAQLDQECQSGDRVVMVNEQYVAYCPRASLQPYETWIVPRAHQPSFEGERTAVERGQLADTLHQVQARLEEVVPGANYNLLVHTSPWGATMNFYHWRLEIRPRITGLAGLELASGVHLNQVSPERAARQLRIG